MTKRLSPAAQAVLNATDYPEDWATRIRVAAALRAAVAHTQQHRGLGVWECDADELLAIADELEGPLKKKPLKGPANSSNCRSLCTQG